MSDDKSYYVYAAKYRGIIVYVGCGKDSRINHCRSGSSHNTGLNELYFRHKIMGDELVMTDMITEAYIICVGWAASQGFTILNLGFVGNELFVTYETNKGLGEE